MKITIESRGELPNNCKGWVVKIEDGEYVQETAFSLFEDKKTFAPVFEAIESKSYEKVKLVKFHYWYLRVSAKYILLRNIKLSNFIKSILQFKLIFKIVQNTNLLTKLLIIVESIINTIWYSFTSTLKSKK